MNRLRDAVADTHMAYLENFLKHTMAYMDAEGNLSLDYMNVTLGKHELKERTY